jgi:hypothetical protein
MRALPSALLVSTAILALGCSDATGPSEGPSVITDPLPSLQIVPASATLASGESRQLRIRFLNQPVFGQGLNTIAWFSSDQGVAIVSSAGFVRGISAGEAVVTAVSGGYRATARVTVLQALTKRDLPPVCVKLEGPSGERVALQC